MFSNEVQPAADVMATEPWQQMQPQIAQDFVFLVLANVDQNAACTKAASMDRSNGKLGSTLKHLTRPRAQPY